LLCQLSLFHFSKFEHAAAWLERKRNVVNKTAGLLTIGTGRDGGRTAHAALDDYVKKGNYKSRERIFVVQRLDRDTSGVLVFARTEKAKLTLQENWPKAAKTYLAFVEGHPDPDEGMIESYLVENDARRVFSSTESPPFLPLRSGPRAASRPTRQKQFPSSKGNESVLVTLTKTVPHQ